MWTSQEIIFRIYEILWLDTLNWIPSTSDISLTCLVILLILDSISGEIINIRRLNSLLRNFIFVTSISYNLRSSLPIGPMLERLWVNTVTLLPQSGGNPLISKKRFKIILCLWIFPLWKLKSQSSRLQIKMVSKNNTVGKTMTLVESHLPIQL